MVDNKQRVKRAKNQLKRGKQTMTNTNTNTNTNKRDVMSSAWKMYNSLKDTIRANSASARATFALCLRQAWKDARKPERAQVEAEARALWANADNSIIELLNVAIVKGAKNSLGAVNYNVLKEAKDTEEAINSIARYYKEEANPKYDAQIRYLLSIIQDAQARQDCIQTLALYVTNFINNDKLSTIKTANSARQLLYYVMLHHAKNAIHVNRPIPNASLDAPIKGTEDITLADTLADTFNSYDGVDARDAINRRAQALNKTERKYLLLYIRCGHNAQKVADIVGTSRQNVNQYIKRIKGKLTLDK